MKTPGICASLTVAVPTVAAPYMVRIQAVPGSGTSSTTLAGPPGDSAWTARADDVAEAPRLRAGETKEVR